MELLSRKWKKNEAWNRMQLFFEAISNHCQHSVEEIRSYSIKKQLLGFEMMLLLNSSVFKDISVVLSTSCLGDENQVLKHPSEKNPTENQTKPKRSKPPPQNTTVTNKTNHSIPDVKHRFHIQNATLWRTCAWFQPQKLQSRTWLI